ncbi:hybrid sensor histidine kinase/response regulator [Stigmatella erecta]|uniref:histidine kinase n=1 Tax=Stigmatella erecta TaxID=83460 RepID=A0A1I0IF16_9BACT|nr:hybrid sensor histidine kinase/response regulator [Stigmatella erecta]SET95564.1 Signal transduction histidine kinase [Stigmatella erecta]
MPVRPVVSNPTVWLLDDSPTETDFIRTALAPTCRLSSFTDGAAFLESLGHSELPDVVVMDWEMPGISGIEVCEYLRSNRATETLPVLMLTSHQRAEDVVRGMEAGANDYVFKPFRPLELVARVQALVRRDLQRKRTLAQEQTQRMMAEDSLAKVQAAEERARAAEVGTRQRAEFERRLIGIVSHDLRNPLSAISLTASAMARQGVSDRQQRGLQRILLSAERATRMIHDLLDFTRARQGGGMAIQRTASDLHAVVGAIVDEVRDAHPDRSIEVTQSGNGVGEWDPDRLEQVASNLLSNALQYSPANTLVRVETRGEDGTLVLEIQNAGPPIPAELLPRIFEPMERGGVQAEQAGSNIGLGLYIVRNLVLAHGGTVSVRSTEAEGTTFTVRLPRQAPSEQD